MRRKIIRNYLILLSVTFLIVLVMLYYPRNKPFAGDPNGGDTEKAATAESLNKLAEQREDDKANPPEIQKREAKPEEKPKGVQKPEKRTETYFLTYKEIVSLKKLSLKDKLFCALILKKMDKTSVNEIIAMAGGGITSAEAVKVEKILGKTLSSRDIDKIYGVIERNMERIPY